jgi:hypothetical protein
MMMKMIENKNNNSAPIAIAIQIPKKPTANPVSSLLDDELNAKPKAMQMKTRIPTSVLADELGFVSLDQVDDQRTEDVTEG